MDLVRHFKYIMSHVTSKLEILGIMHGEIYFKFMKPRTGKTWALCSSFRWMKR